jgi:hypothetical protein
VSSSPSPTTPAGRRSRRRLLLTLGAISLGWKVLVLTLGAAVPKWVIDDGVGALPSELRPYARDAKVTAARLWNGPIERHGVVRTLRVVSVSRVSDARAAGAAARRCGGLEARVRAYTYFAVPYSEARLVCDSGVVEYRVFRSRPGAAKTPASADLRGSD